MLVYAGCGTGSSYYYRQLCKTPKPPSNIIYIHIFKEPNDPDIIYSLYQLSHINSPELPCLSDRFVIIGNEIGREVGLLRQAAQVIREGR